MTYKEALQKFGLPASAKYRDDIRHLLEAETEQECREEGQEEILRTLCVQLFSIGEVEDALLIWRAKRSSFDMWCGLDIQFLCGAGLEATKMFLATVDTLEATKALDYLISCEQGGNFKDWSPQKTLAFHRRYYHLDG